MPDGTPRAHDRLLAIFSDVEMGTGGPLDDFPHPEFLAGLIDAYGEHPRQDLAIDLVFNGDTFDFLKTPVDDAFPRHITAESALTKLEAVAAAHQPFFEAVRRFLAGPAGAGERQVHFVVGNHDAELLFPEVQERLRALCGGDPRVSFPGFRLVIGRVLIEHGSQSDRLFQMDEQQPFVEFGGERMLHISWGAAALLDTVIPLKGLLGFLDRVKPRSQLLDLMPEVRDLLMDRFWSYWLRDFWRGYFGAGDPTRQLTWSMLKEVAWRATSRNADVERSESLRQRLAASDEFRLYVLGHHHEALWIGFGDRKLLQSGCMRNEYMIADGGEVLRPIPKCYVEALLRGGQPVVSRFVELEAPPAPEGYVPASIFDVLPGVRALGLAGTRADQLAQEQRERAAHGQG